MPRLTRPGWLALGAAGAAYGVVQLGLPIGSIVAPALAALAGVLLWGRLIPTASAGVVGGIRVDRSPWRIALAALAIGALAVSVRTCAGPATPDDAPVGERGAWRARVVSVGGTFEARQRAVVHLEPPGAGSVYVRLPRYPVVAAGDTIAFEARLEPPPLDDGFAAYLGRIGVTATAEVRSMHIDVTGGDPIERIRRGVGDALANVLTEPEAGLAAGIMVGLRDRVARDVADALTTAGLSHIVAISGWNIAVVAAIVAALLRRWPRRWRAMATIAVIAAYTIVAGASPSVVRAALMAGVVLTAREGGRAGHAAAALSLAALLMLLAEPATVADAGFLLSVAATAGLLAWATPIDEVDRGARAEPDADLDRRGAGRVPVRPGRHPAHRPARLRAAVPGGPDRQPGRSTPRPAGDGRGGAGRAGRLAHRRRSARCHRHPHRPGGPGHVRRPDRDRPRLGVRAAGVDLPRSDGRRGDGGHVDDRHRVHGASAPMAGTRARGAGRGGRRLAGGARPTGGRGPCIRRCHERRSAQRWPRCAGQA